MESYYGSPVTAEDGTITFFKPRYVVELRDSEIFREAGGILYDAEGNKVDEIRYLQDADYYEYAYDGRPIKEEISAGLVLPTNEEMEEAFEKAFGSLSNEELSDLRSALSQNDEDINEFNRDYWKRQNRQDPESEDWEGIDELMNETLRILR